MFGMFTTLTNRLIRANLFLVCGFEPGRLVGDARFFFCADLAGLQRIRGDNVHFVVAHHLVDAHHDRSVRAQHYPTPLTAGYLCGIDSLYAACSKSEKNH